MPTINQALGINPLVAGLGARAVDGSTAIGVEARSDNRNSTAIGRNAQALGPDTTAIGTETTAPTNWNTVIGYEAGSFENGENVVIIGRKAEAQGNNGVAVGETARANGADATALGRNADALSPQSFAAGFDSSATAEGAIAIGEGTANTVPDSVDIGPRDYVISDGNSLVFPTGAGRQTLVEKALDGSNTAGTPVGYTLSVGGQTIAEVFAEADGAGGVQNARLDVPVSLSVAGDTTEVDDVVTGDVLVEDGSQVTQFRLDATAPAPVAEFGDNTLDNVGDVSFPTVGGSPTFTDHNHAESGLTTVPNSGLTNDSVTVSSGNALTGGGTVALGGSTTLGVATGAIGSTELVNDSVTVSSGNALTGGGTVALGGSTTLDVASGSIGSTELTNDSVTLNGGENISAGSASLGGSASVNLTATLGSVEEVQFNNVEDVSATGGALGFDLSEGLLRSDGSTTYVVADGENLSGGTDISISGGVGAGSAPITVSHANTSNQGNVSAGAGRAIDAVNLDGNGHVTGIGTEDFDNRYVLESGDTMSDELTISGTDGSSNSLTVSGHIAMNGNAIGGDPVIRLGNADSLRLFDGNGRLEVFTGGDFRIANGDGSGDLLELRDGQAGTGQVRARFREFGDLDMEGELTENAAL